MVGKKGRTDGRMEGRTDGPTDGRTDGRTEGLTEIPPLCPSGHRPFEAAAQKEIRIETQGNGE